MATPIPKVGKVGRIPVAMPTLRGVDSKVLRASSSKHAETQTSCSKVFRLGHP
jgi:hypothetical protein